MSEGQVETNSAVETKAPDAPDNNQVESQPQQVEGTNSNSTKGRRSTPNKPKISRIMKDVQEGEALLKEMGHEIDGADEGRRRTRSSTRGGAPPPPTPPPVKRERRSGSSQANNSAEKQQNSTAASNRGRGRPKQNEKKEEAPSEDKLEEAKPEATPSSNSDAVDHNHESVKSASVETKTKDKELPERVNADVVSNDSEPEPKVQKSSEKVAEPVEKKVDTPPLPGNNINAPAPTRNDTNAQKKLESQTVISTPPPAPVPAAGSTTSTSPPAESKAAAAEPAKDIPSNATTLPPNSESDSAQANSNSSAEPKPTDAEKVQ